MEPEKKLARRREQAIRLSDQQTSKPGRTIIRHLPLISEHKGRHHDFAAWDRNAGERTYLTAHHDGQKPGRYRFEFQTPLDQYDIQGLMRHLKAHSEQLENPLEEQDYTEKIIGPMRFVHLADREINVGSQTYHLRLRTRDAPSMEGTPLQHIIIGIEQPERARRDPAGWDTDPLVQVQAEMREGFNPHVKIHIFGREANISHEEVKKLVRLFFHRQFAERGTPKTGRTKKLPPGRKGLH